MKTCNRCGQRKPDDKFHRVFAAGKFYLHGYCKLCQRMLSRERWRRNALKAKADSPTVLPGCDQTAFPASVSMT